MCALIHAQYYSAVVAQPDDGQRCLGILVSRNIQRLNNEDLFVGFGWL